MDTMKYFIFLVACIGFSMFGARPANGQGTKKDSSAANIRLSPEQLKACEGYYQSPQNKDMVVRISAVENGLTAKLLWNNGEIHLAPESELGFVAKEGGDEGPIHLLFHRDSSGLVSELDVAKNGTWNRVKDYKPVVKKEMEHTPAQLAPFQGLYQAREDNSRFLQFYLKDNNLVLKQMWDGTEIPFLPESELAFFTRSMPMFSLDFTKDKDGNITQVLAFKRDVWIRTKALALTPAILRTYEGRFRSKDDPDNEIRIIAKDSNLVIKQLWDGKETVVKPMTDTYFYNDALSYPLQIVMGPDGKVSQVVLLITNVFNLVAK
jgi:hypothetical protein